MADSEARRSWREMKQARHHCAVETGNLKLIVHIVTVAADKHPLIHLVAINSGGAMLYLYIHQVS